MLMTGSGYIDMLGVEFPTSFLYLEKGYKDTVLDFFCIGFRDVGDFSVQSFAGR